MSQEWRPRPTGAMVVRGMDVAAAAAEAAVAAGKTTVGGMSDRRWMGERRSRLALRKVRMALEDENWR